MREMAAFLDTCGWGGVVPMPLAGDASFRRYHRLQRNGRRAVLMDAPAPHEDVTPYIAVSTLLRGLGFSAPEVFAEDRTGGFLLIEDFGDGTYTRLLDHGADERALYSLAVDTLVELQRAVERCGFECAGCNVPGCLCDPLHEPGHPEQAHDPAEVEAALARIDKRMAYFNQVDLTPRAPANAGEEELFTARAKLARAALRSIYFTGAFMELEEHQRLHPGVQERMRRMQPEMDDAVLGITELLESLTPAEYRALKSELKREPDAGLRIG